MCPDALKYEEISSRKENAAVIQNSVGLKPHLLSSNNQKKKVKKQLSSAGLNF